jgi:hypothetical protein
MRKLKIFASAIAIFVLGVATGAIFTRSVPVAHAQQEPETTQYPRDVLEAYKKANKSVRELTNLFVASGKSTAAFTGLNYFAASVGGIDAERDLEEGRGVDPETFAALYADNAAPRIAQHLDYDELGRLRYKKTVIRLYSRDRLKQLFQLRDRLEVRSEAGP